MKSKFSMVILITMAVALPLLLTSTTKGDNVDSPTAQPAPSWSAPSLDGKAVSSSDYVGKVVILDFWATWCGPCKAELPGFIELQKQYSKDGLVIIGASVDEDGAKVLKPFAKQVGIDYPIVFASEKMQNDFGGIEGIPTTFVIDRHGNIVSKHVGLMTKQEFENEIKPLLTAEK